MYRKSTSPIGVPTDEIIRKDIFSASRDELLTSQTSAKAFIVSDICSWHSPESAPNVLEMDWSYSKKSSFALIGPLPEIEASITSGYAVRSQQAEAPA
eukprot:scaffold13836_cov74-Phaeocystis_antarctica.AAC.2